MSKRIAVAISGDPHSTHLPVEALRIALGLCSGGHDITVILSGKASRLLASDVDDVVDGEILEKYRPSFHQLQVPFWVDTELSEQGLLHGFLVSRHPAHEIRSFLQTVDRALIFS